MIIWDKAVKKQKIYIAGKYSDEDPHSIEDNTAKARAAVITILEKGHTPIAHQLLFPDLGDRFDSPTLRIHAMDLLEVCDAIYFMPGYRKSKGAMAEYDYAVRNGKETYFELNQIKKVVL